MKTKKFTLLIIALASVVCAKADMLAYFSFNNVKLESGSIGVFLNSGDKELYDTATRVISKASSGVKADTATLNLSAFTGEMGGAINHSNANWGAYFGTKFGAMDDFPAGGALALGSGLNGKYVVMSLNSEGYEDLKVFFTTRSSAQNGATKITWEFSTDGVEFKPASATTLYQDNTYTVNSVSLSSFKELANAKTVYLRFCFDGLKGNGNVRIDNIRITGSKIE